MEEIEIRDKIREIYPYTNLLIEKPIGYYEVGVHLIALYRIIDIINKGYFYSCTVITLNRLNNKYEYNENLSISFNNKEEAIQFINNLKN